MSDIRRHVLVADDHPAVRRGLAQAIDAQDELETAWEAGTPAEVIEIATSHIPDLVLMDLTFAEGGAAGLDLIRKMRSIRPGTPVLVVSMHDEQLYAERALAAGARGYVMKHADEATFLQAVHAVLAGEQYVSEALEHTGDAEAEDPVQQITDRELEIFEMLGAGFQPRHIAEKLYLSVKTVNTHQRHLKEKLGVGDAATLRRYAVRWCRDREYE